MRTGVYRAFRRRLSGERGFSLIELLVAMLIMLVVLGGIYTIWFGLQRTYSFTDEDMTAQEQARSALGEMVELIRTARQPESPPSEDLAMVIVSADVDTLVCWTDTDKDDNHDLELVRFRVDSEHRTLYRDDSQTGDATFASAHSTRLVGSWVGNNTSTRPLFTYIGANGTTLSTPVSDPTQIRQVIIDLFIDVYQDKAPISHELKSTVQPRNLRQY
jgi:prepilin-type N-terminal cleavage/methylation domain-containing protein